MEKKELQKSKQAHNGKYILVASVICQTRSGLPVLDIPLIYIPYNSEHVIERSVKSVSSQSYFFQHCCNFWQVDTQVSEIYLYLFSTTYTQNSKAAAGIAIS